MLQYNNIIIFLQQILSHGKFTLSLNAKSREIDERKGIVTVEQWHTCVMYMTQRLLTNTDIEILASIVTVEQWHTCVMYMTQRLLTNTDIEILAWSFELFQVFWVSMEHCQSRNPKICETNDFLGKHRSKTDLLDRCRLLRKCYFALKAVFL